MKIAIDAMGGDYAPEEIVKGAVQAAQAYPETEIILVGQSERINEFLPTSDRPRNLSLREATEVISMDEHPANAVRKKRMLQLLWLPEWLKKEKRMRWSALVVLAHKWPLVC